MVKYINIQYPSATVGTLVDVDSVKTVVRTSATVITIHFNDATTMALTNTSDSTNNTLKAYNDALALAADTRTVPGSVVDVQLPDGISVSGVAVAVLA